MTPAFPWLPSSWPVATADAPVTVAQFGTNALIHELADRGDLGLAVAAYRRLYGDPDPSSNQSAPAPHPDGGAGAGAKEVSMAQQQDASRRPGSSTMQKHADEIRTLVAVFRDEPVSASSVEWLTGRLEGLADRMSPLAPAPPVRPRRRLRAVR